MTTKSGPPKTGQIGGMAVDTALVRELAEMLGETGLSEIEVEDGNRKIRVSRAVSVAAPVQSVAAPLVAAAPAAAPVAAAPAAASDAAPAAASANAVKSPMVGTCYLAADPEAPAFASVGSSVAEGDTILIIEAMKVMNPITAPRGGKLSAMLVTNGQPVEFDQPLFVID
jgi:acetyl-CoA carboxylase biotin carboxyl carrier protein